MTRSAADLLVPARELKILDFDIETRLVGFYEAGRFKPKGSEPIAIAASFVGEKTIHVWMQPELRVDQMLEEFRPLYDEADIVTGHYIRKFDLPLLNGALFEQGLPLLGRKLAQDTKVDLVSFEGLAKNQEALSELLQVFESKYHMNDPRWRAATRFTEEGVKRTRKRVTGDVRQHKRLRELLLEAGALKAPTLWEP